MRALGIHLPEVNPPKGLYIPAVVSGDLVFVAGQIPMVRGRLMKTGKVGAEVTPADAKALSAQCVLSALAAIDDLAGLDSVVQVVKVVGYVASASGFTAQPDVVDGASELLTSIFGASGRHARSAVGVADLPLDAPVEIEILVEVAPTTGTTATDPS
jgi:enamine deaminase RidA (YjgF/YER057c/UK114 family)